MDHLNLFSHACEQMLANGASPEYTAQCLIATLDELAALTREVNPGLGARYRPAIEVAKRPLGWDHI